MNDARLCPMCAGDTVVKDTRVGIKGLWRRRVCPICNYGFKTFEITEDELEKLQSLASPAEQANFLAFKKLVEQCSVKR